MRIKRTGSNLMVQDRELVRRRLEYARQGVRNSLSKEAVDDLDMMANDLLGLGHFLEYIAVKREAAEHYLVLGRVNEARLSLARASTVAAKMRRYMDVITLREMILGLPEYSIPLLERAINMVFLGHAYNTFVPRSDRNYDGGVIDL